MPSPPLAVITLLNFCFLPSHDPHIDCNITEQAHSKAHNNLNIVKLFYPLSSRRDHRKGEGWE